MIPSIKIQRQQELERAKTRYWETRARMLIGVVTNQGKTIKKLSAIPQSDQLAIGKYLNVIYDIASDPKNYHDGHAEGLETALVIIDEIDSSLGVDGPETITGLLRRIRETIKHNIDIEKEEDT